MKLYGLFEYTYDWYEWEELVVVSKSKEKLEKYYENYKGQYGKFQLVEEQLHKVFQDDGHNHMVIKEVENI